jgi:hypothetical protein
MDAENKLKGLDPTSPQDPRGEAARSTMSAAIARGSEPEAAKPSRFRRPRVIIAGLGTSAAATAAALVAFVGGGSTISAAAALADAASQTSHFSSGVVTTHTVNNNGGKLDALTTLRFSGTDADVVGQGTSQLDGQEAQTSNLEVIITGGKRYTKKDGGDWTVEDAGQQASYGDAIAGAGLVSLVQNASDVTQNGSTFHATVKGSDLAQVQTSPLGYDNATNASEVSVTIELAADGSVSKLEVDNDGTQRVTEFSEMGQPQTISAPTS